MRWMLFIGLFILNDLHSQSIQYFQTANPGDFRSWVFLDRDESFLGNLNARWPFERRLDEWDLRIGEWSGSVKLRWSNRPDEWEIRLHNEFLTAQPTWNKQFDSWRLQYGDKTYSFTLDPDPDGQLWRLQMGDHELLLIYNTYLYDYLDWTLDYASDVDELVLVTTACFIAAYYGNYQYLKR
ncbi:MAG: hypothetical protein IPM34_05240 [Saprospiraceae bacterium]|nr:hypothetical protein [Saprospiraceae bacterium]